MDHEQLVYTIGFLFIVLVFMLGFAIGWIVGRIGKTKDE